MNKTLPTIFVSHGSPMIALEPREAGRFMQALGEDIVARWGRPRAVIVISAHSLTREPVHLRRRWWFSRPARSVQRRFV